MDRAAENNEFRQHFRDKRAAVRTSGSGGEKSANKVVYNGPKVLKEHIPQSTAKKWLPENCFFVA